MNSLDSTIKLLNDSIKKDITGTFNIEGVCRVTGRGAERLIYNSKGDSILFDDKFNHYAYYISSGTSYSLLKSGGKKRVYNAVSAVELICFSSDPNFKAYIMSRISTRKEIILKDENNNSLEIFKREVNQDKYDPKRFVFSARIEVTYKTDTCYECSEQVCNS